MALRMEICQADDINTGEYKKDMARKIYLDKVKKWSIFPT
jgi:hypothetical protein